MLKKRFKKIKKLSMFEDFEKKLESYTNISKKN